MKNHAACVLRAAAIRQQAAARRPRGFSCVPLVHNTFTQHTSEIIAGNSIAPLVEMQRKLKYPYVQLGVACGMRQSMNRRSKTLI